MFVPGSIHAGVHPMSSSFISHRNNPNPFPQSKSLFPSSFQPTQPSMFVVPHYSRVRRNLGTNFIPVVDCLPITVSGFSTTMLPLDSNRVGNLPTGNSFFFSNHFMCMCVFFFVCFHIQNPTDAAPRHPLPHLSQLRRLLFRTPPKHQ